MTNPVRARRYRAKYEAEIRGWRFRPLPAEWWDEQQQKAIARMEVQDRMIRDGCGLMGRTTVDMVRVGPLRTDEWQAPPSMDGIGRRLGRLSDRELLAAEFGRW